MLNYKLYGKGILNIKLSVILFTAIILILLCNIYIIVFRFKVNLWLLTIWFCILIYVENPCYAIHTRTVNTWLYNSVSGNWLLIVTLTCRIYEVSHAGYSVRFSERGRMYAVQYKLYLWSILYMTSYVWCTMYNIMYIAYLYAM